jgi:polar amino acid transport system substrate-binding protein
MNLTTRAGRRLGVIACATVLVLAAASCGSDSGDAGATSPSASPAASVDPSLKAMVPADVAADGKLVVGSDASYAPNEFMDTDGKTVIGMDVEVFSAVAAKLGLTAQFVNAPFDSIITGVGSGKYEVGVSSFTITAEREKQANMVSYFNAPTQWATKKGNPDGIDIAAPCGKKIAVQKATVQVPDIQKRSADCKTAGKPEVTIDQYQGQDEATASVVSGKDQAMLADLPISAYAVQQTGGKLEILGDPYGDGPYGFVTAKDATDLANAIAGATKAIIADGSYTAIMKKWGDEKGAITADQVKVNPAQ